MTIREEQNKAGHDLIERCRRARRDDRLAVLEGFHALKHALRFDAEIEAVWTEDQVKLLELSESLAPDLSEHLVGLAEPVASDVFRKLAPRAPETGVIALAKRPRSEAGRILLGHREAPTIWLEDPAHLGNVGAVVRVAAAAGAFAVLTSGRHDPWDPAALRGSAGLHFALPVLQFGGLPEGNGPLIAIDPEGDQLRPRCLPENAILAFGSERQGLSAQTLDRAEQRLALPMRPHVSSLNLATSVAAVLYAWKLSNAASGL
jgi:TrmH family RNA methyltransferase